MEIPATGRPMIGGGFPCHCPAVCLHLLTLWAAECRLALVMAHGVSSFGRCVEDRLQRGGNPAAALAVRPGAGRAFFAKPICRGAGVL